MKRRVATSSSSWAVRRDARGGRNVSESELALRSEVAEREDENGDSGLMRGEGTAGQGRAIGDEVWARSLPTVVVSLLLLSLSDARGYAWG